MPAASHASPIRRHPQHGHQRTLFNAVRREVQSPHEMKHSTSCPHANTTVLATVVLLDCSHSMILLREDRFTPANVWPWALPISFARISGDTLEPRSFHDSAEEFPSASSPAFRSPYYTNTREGYARPAYPLRQKKTSPNVMITRQAFRPHLEDGVLQKGLRPRPVRSRPDPREVNKCSARIMINTSCSPATISSSTLSRITPCAVQGLLQPLPTPSANTLSWNTCPQERAPSL